MQSDSDPLPASILISSFLLTGSVINGGVIFAILFVVVLLICSAMISGSEVAYFSLSPTDVDELKEDDGRAAKRILKLREKPRELLATILIANNFINIGIILISDYIINQIINKTWLDSVASDLIAALSLSGVIEIDSLSRFINFLFAIVGVTFLLVLFGEVAPKIYAQLNNVRLARNMSRPLAYLKRIFYPLSQPLVRWSNRIENKLSLASNGKTTKKEDIGQAIEITVQNEHNAKAEIDFLKSIVNFNDVAVKQIMKSRVDVVAVEDDINYTTLLEMVISSGYSRIPVYQEDFDHLIGILYAKDLLPFTKQDENFKWQDLIRDDILYVPETRKISDLMKDFQSRKLHMAIVVDEYGGSAGIATLEDIMEEVVGEIKDEFDSNNELEYRKIDAWNFIFDGKTLLNDMCRLLDLDLDTFNDMKGESDTLAGLILEIQGVIPKAGTEIMYKDIILKAVSVTKRRIEQVKITLPKNEHETISS